MLFPVRFTVVLFHYVIELFLNFPAFQVLVPVRLVDRNPGEGDLHEDALRKGLDLLVHVLESIEKERNSTRVMVMLPWRLFVWKWI